MSGMVAAGERRREEWVSLYEGVGAAAGVSAGGAVGAGAVQSRWEELWPGLA